MPDTNDVTEREAGVADVMALHEDFATDTVEAYEALSQRMKGLEDDLAWFKGVVLTYFEGKRDDLQTDLEALERIKR
jgi:hypothetical protein